MEHSTLENTVESNERVSDMLLELSLYDDSLSKELNIVLITDSEDMKKLNYFIFNDVQGIHYYTMDSPYDSDFSILSQMDVIIFNKDDKKLEEMLLENIKSKHLNCKFFYLVDKKYFRKLDILDEYFKGVDRVLKVDIELEDYIFELQRELNSNFYSKRLKNIESATLLKDEETFLNRVNQLTNEKIFFSKVSYSYESDIDINEYNLKKIVREKDSIYIDVESTSITFILLDIMPDKADEILKRRVEKFSIYLNLKVKKSVFDLVFD